MNDRTSALIDAWLDGRLAPGEDDDLRAALADAGVAAEAAALLRIEAELRGLRAASTPSTVPGPARRSRAPRSRRRARTWGIVAVAAALVIAATVALSHVADSPRLIVADAGDAATAIRAGAQRTLADGDALSAGDRVRAERDVLRLRYVGEATALDLEPGGELTILADDAGKRLRLDDGALTATVAPQPSGQPLVATTAHAAAVVVGTRFRLSTDDQATHLAVDEGSVALRSRDAERIVAAGHEATATAAGLDHPWEPLFTEDLAGWTATTGTMARVGEVVVVTGENADERGRIEGARPWRDVELRCRLHCTGPLMRAEVQVHRYWRLFAVTWSEPGWKEIVLIARGGRYHATIDGEPVPVEDEDTDSDPSADPGGPLAFFVTRGARLEISDARVRPLP